jgi:hypothetical protein
VTHLTWSEEIGKRVRSGTWPDQAISTVQKIEEALHEGRSEIAAELVDYFMEEAKVCYAIYALWFRGFVDWLDQQGVPSQERDAELARLAQLMAFPDGEPFEPTSRWRALGERAGRLGNLIRGGDIAIADAMHELDGLREDWRRLHDRYVDMISGVLTYVARRFGEARLEDCYRFVLEPYIQERYMPFDVRVRDYEDTLFRNVYLSFEAMRGHLCGPGRRGDIEFEEHEDRWVLRFDPCGSGGRTLRGDPVEGTGSRAESPYCFGVTQGKHDWAWNEKGVCYYCAHCCLALERLPAERWGHPVRVVDSPLYPTETSGPNPTKCQWTIYKSLEAIPPEAYERIGLSKPRPPDAANTTTEDLPSNCGG